MIVSVIYSNRAGARFDADYYAKTHTALVREIWKPDRVELILGTDAPGGGMSPYAMIAHFHFASAEAMGAAMADPRGGELRADVANFTDLEPQVMIGRMLS